MGGQVIGDDTIRISRVSSLTNAQSGDICFINDAKYQKALTASQASAFVLRERDAALTAQPKIIVENPYAYFAKISTLLNPPATSHIGCLLYTSFAIKLSWIANAFFNEEAAGA